MGLSLSPSTTSDLNLFLIALMAAQLPSHTFPHEVVVAKLLCPDFTLYPGLCEPMKGGILSLFTLFPSFSPFDLFLLLWLFSHFIAAVGVLSEIIEQNQKTNKI